MARPRKTKKQVSAARRKAALARWGSLTPEQRREQTNKAVKAMREAKENR